MVQRLSRKELYDLADEVERWSNWALAQVGRIDPTIGGSFIESMQDENATAPTREGQKSERVTIRP